MTHLPTRFDKSGPGVYDKKNIHRVRGSAMYQVLTAAQMRAADLYTIQEMGVPSAVLMERAALSAADEVMELLPSGDASVLVLAGAGNNGGDGFACARILSLKGIQVSVCFAGKADHMSVDAASQRKICEKLGIRILPLSEMEEEAARELPSRADVVVDALFGTGLARDISGKAALLIEAVNHARAKVLSIDIPSGIDTDTGAVLGCAVRADVTVAMQCRKPGLLLYPGAAYSGQVKAAEIGIVTDTRKKDSAKSGEAERALRIRAFTAEDLPQLLPARPADGNKGTFGKVLLIAGSAGMAGAAILCAEACLRSGAGMVKLLTHESNRGILQAALPEAMLATFSNEKEALVQLEAVCPWCDVIGIGPGLGTGSAQNAMLKRLLTVNKKPLVLDADALNLLSSDPSILREAACPVYVTPHIGEMSRLSRHSAEELKADPLTHAAAFASQYRLICVMKDARTVIAGPEGVLYLNLGGNSGMATAGSGDVLTGILASMLAQGAEGETAAAAAVCLHAAAGDAAGEALGEQYMTARDLIGHLSRVFSHSTGSGKPAGQERLPLRERGICALHDTMPKDCEDLGSGQPKPCSRVLAEISLDAVTHNLDVMRERLGDRPKICAVVKANAYGHGAVPIARHIEAREDLWGFAVATAEEGEELYDAGIRKPILILGYVFPESYPIVLRCNLRACIFDMESAKALSDLATRCGRKAYIHIALDTGMSRIGFQVTEENALAVQATSTYPGIEIEGLFSHFARCDEKRMSPAIGQLVRYEHFEQFLDELGVKIPIHHLCNSAGIMRFPEAKRDMVRAGITLYGLYPSDDVAVEMTELRSVMRITSHISFLKTLPAGRRISYGGTFRTERNTRVATIPVGYADGYPRLLSNKGEVLIRGKRAPILGRVCMDQFMVDVSEIPEACRGDEVVLLGEQGRERITAEELGQLSGRFNYELVCNFSGRVPRRYN